MTITNQESFVFILGGCMPKIFCAFFLSLLISVPFAARAEYDYDLDVDTSDPLYLLQDDTILSESGISYGHDRLRLVQGLSYGLNDRLSISGRVHYQVDFAGRGDGFSSIDVGSTYRMGRAEDNDARLISDLLLGFKFGGSSHVRTPEFADSSYYAGLRFGRQWAGVSLAGTIKSTWVFDDTRGLSYIDFIPESYFRLDNDWRAGFGFTFRKSTNPKILNNQEWLNWKLLCQFGRTQYIGHVDYEFEDNEVRVGLKANILF